jgi:UDPglucose 6-dehydrogenase
VCACDPSSPKLPAELGFVSFESNPVAAVARAEVVAVCTPWPEFRTLDWSAMLAGRKGVVVIDAARFLEKSIAKLPGVTYLAVGTPA